MSNFTGVTFAQQKVLPSDDAIIRRNILSDGVLYGCQLSYSGSTLTMGAGQLLICGRQIRHPSAQNWAVADATSGFARLVLTVDLTRTSSKEVFEQVVDSIEYATSQDGFPELNQSDVNTTGSVYQVAACVVSLGTGGITGIVSQLGPCEVSGGGGLNFKLVGGLTQPAGLAENTIWVITDIEITGYDFNATQPADPMEGMVWITVGRSSHVEFNALKTNGIQVYPNSAKQYVGGAWVDVEARSYQGGEWRELIPEGALYWKGDNLTEITGGWQFGEGRSSGGGIGSYKDNGDSVTLTTQSGSKATTIQMCTTDKISFNGYNRLKVDLSEASQYTWLKYGNSVQMADGVGRSNTLGAGVHELDISGQTGSFYVAVEAYSGGVATVVKVWLE